MIGRLSGTLVEKQPNQVIVDVGGVGYCVLISLSTYTALGDINDAVTLLIHTHLREDQLQLYGFLTARERKLFEMLISVSGVGPALALKVLSGRNAEELSAAIQRGAVEKLVGIPGIGKKTAERIVMELRDRLAGAVSEGVDSGGAASGVEAEVASALANLGYDRREIDDALGRILRRRPVTAGFEPLFRSALAELSAATKTAARSRAKG